MEISAAEFVINKLGGLTKTAKAMSDRLEKPFAVSTVQGWQERGTVPQWHWNDLIAIAAEAGETIEIGDFLTTHPGTEAAA